jgi:exonuclease III
MKLNISVVALQEIRYKRQEQINKKDCSLFFSGPKNRTGQLGTGFVTNNKMKKHLIGFKPIGERLCKIRFKGRFRNITMLSAHAPTEEKDVTEEEQFYDLLSKTCDQVQIMICSLFLVILMPRFVEKTIQHKLLVNTLYTMKQVQTEIY